MAQLVDTIVTTVAASTIRYRCDLCGDQIVVEHPGYTLEYPADATPEEREALRAPIWSAIREVWRHRGKCRTFTQADFTSGAAREWLVAAHQEAS